MNGFFAPPRLREKFSSLQFGSLPNFRDLAFLDFSKDSPVGRTVSRKVSRGDAKARRT